MLTSEQVYIKGQVTHWTETAFLHREEHEQTLSFTHGSSPTPAARQAKRVLSCSLEYSCPLGPKTRPDNSGDTQHMSV